MEENKEIKTMWKEALLLTVITVLAGLILGFVNELTKEPIRLQKERAVKEACEAVFPGQENLNFVPVSEAPGPLLTEELKSMGVEIGTIYSANREQERIGYVVESTSTQGYGGDIVLYVGVKEDGTLSDVSILQISETPGLGMQAEKVLLPQLHDRSVPQLRYTKSGSTQEDEIDAISGATITTKAVTNAVNGALKTISEMKGGRGDE